MALSFFLVKRKTFMWSFPFTKMSPRSSNSNHCKEDLKTKERYQLPGWEHSWSVHWLVFFPPLQWSPFCSGKYFNPVEILEYCANIKLLTCWRYWRRPPRYRSTAWSCRSLQKLHRRNSAQSCRLQSCIFHELTSRWRVSQKTFIFHSNHNKAFF